MNNEVGKFDKQLESSEEIVENKISPNDMRNSDGSPMFLTDDQIDQITGFKDLDEDDDFLNYRD